MPNLPTFLERLNSNEVIRAMLAVAETSLKVRERLPYARSTTKGVNPFGESQAELDVFANEAFADALLGTGEVASVASEEMAEARRANSGGGLHVAMDPLDGSSNIATNNPLGSIFGFFTSPLPSDGSDMIAAAFVTYGPVLTITLAHEGLEGVSTFAAVGGKGNGAPAPRRTDEAGTSFELVADHLSIPDKQEVFGMGGLRKDWIRPVETFVGSLEERGVKLRYGGTLVGDYNQVLHYGGIFGYPALRSKPKGKLRLLYEAAPMAFVTAKAGGTSSDGQGDILRLKATKLAETTPLFLGVGSLVRELESLIASKSSG